MISSEHARLWLGALLLSTWACNDSRGPATCRPPEEIENIALVALEPALGGLKFLKPVQLIAHPVDRDAWVVVEHAGAVHLVRNARKETYFDMSDRVEAGRQWGLHEIAFHPRFPDDPRIFASYVAKENVSTVSSFRATQDGRTLDTASETVLLSEPQPGPYHPIAGLAFGPDGFLYVGWGEGDGKGQNLQLLGGKVLRIDVDRAENGRRYGIPRDNPYVRTRARPEIFAIGFRNPWRFTFDRATGELWLGDVGDRRYEEINLIKTGENYGWPVWEGTECVARDDTTRCTDDFAFPVVQHSHTELSSITAGYVYRGNAIPALRGRYVYADHANGSIWALTRGEDGKMESEPIMYSRHKIAAFALGDDGELYVVDTEEFDPPPPDGMIYKLVAAPALNARNDTPVQTLSSLRCIGERPDTEPPGLIAYTINHPPWDDGAMTYRFASPTDMMPVYGNQDVLERPRRAVLIKTFIVDGQPIETQMLVHLKDGTWRGIDYEWAPDGRDATPLAHAKTKTLASGKRWGFPGPNGCMRCHNPRSGAVLGLSISQMATRAEGPDQLAWLESRGMFKRREPFESPPPLPALGDEAAPLDERARTYLHVNCAHCHQPGGNVGEASMDLRRSTPERLMRTCDVAPSATLPGHEDAVLVEPGHPERSLLSIRMQRTDSAAMPPGRHSVDLAAARVVDEWIRRLQSCPQ